MSTNILQWNATAAKAAELGFHALAYKILNAVHVEVGETFTDYKGQIFVDIQFSLVERQLIDIVNYHS